MKYENATIEIDKRRWNVYITITEQDGTKHKLMASSDSGVTYNDGIFFDTPEEYERLIEE